MAIRREGAIEATMAGLKFYHLDAAVQRHGLAFLASIASSASSSIFWYSPRNLLKTHREKWGWRKRVCSPGKRVHKALATRNTSQIPLTLVYP